MEIEQTANYDKVIEQFVLLWGEMASAWGINKTMAQIHAFLYAVNEPLDTDAIMSGLGISRGNANMNLRNLIKWKLIYKVHKKGERKDYYIAEKDVWNIVSIIIKERQEREITPIQENLRNCITVFEETGSNITEEEKELKERLENFIEFLEMFNRFTEALLPYINKKNLKFLKQLVKLAEAHHTFRTSAKNEQTGQTE